MRINKEILVVKGLKHMIPIINIIFDFDWLGYA